MIIKIMIEPLSWHILPYKRNDNIDGKDVTQVGFLCLKLVIIKIKSTTH